MQDTEKSRKQQLKHNLKNVLGQNAPIMEEICLICVQAKHTYQTNAEGRENNEMPY